MIKVRKLLTKEIYDQFCETNFLSDEDLIAWMDTYKALEILTKYSIFSRYHVEAIQAQSYGLENRFRKLENISNFEWENPIHISDSEVMSFDIYDKFMKNMRLLSIEEIKIISIHLVNIVKLIEFDPIRYLILSEWCVNKISILGEYILNQSNK